MDYLRTVPAGDRISRMLNITWAWHADTAAWQLVLARRQTGRVEAAKAIAQLQARDSGHPHQKQAQGLLAQWPR